MKKIPVGILGATGMVGQHYVQRLADHPLFEIVFLAASPSSAGKSYGKAIEGREFYPIAPSIAAMPVHAIDLFLAKRKNRSASR
jgi:aspartate-semialdehyde dehydrogenase